MSSGHLPKLVAFDLEYGSRTRITDVARCVADSYPSSESTATLFGACTLMDALVKSHLIPPERPSSPYCVTYPSQGPIRRDAQALNAVKDK